MAFLELFDRAEKHVADQGVKVTLKRGKPVSASVLEESKSKSVIPIPDELCAFYTELGDGLLFRWTTDEDRGPFANIEFPELSQVVIPSLNGIRGRIEWSDSYDFRYTKDPKLAKSTAIRMRKWLRFHAEGNGDHFCFDTGTAGTPVVFDQHDWMDGGNGDNGHQLGTSLLRFYNDWSKVCFQYPENLWWPGVFHEGGGVNWSSKEFRTPFRLLGGR